MRSYWFAAGANHFCMPTDTALRLPRQLSVLHFLCADYNLCIHCCSPPSGHRSHNWGGVSQRSRQVHQCGVHASGLGIFTVCKEVHWRLQTKGTASSPPHQQCRNSLSAIWSVPLEVQSWSDVHLLLLHVWFNCLTSPWDYVRKCIRNKLWPKLDNASRRTSVCGINHWPYTQRCRNISVQYSRM